MCPQENDLKSSSSSTSISEEKDELIADIDTSPSTPLNYSSTNTCNKPTIWYLLRGAAINLLLPFVNGLMLGFGELFAHEAAFRLGWGGTKVFPAGRRRRFIGLGNLQDHQSVKGKGRLLRETASLE
ncbi:Bgt-2688 [Blumeria graminis f. sp. tritici]|uniref:Bgt-2688 n=2 Tax=Blumeria graminis f. sp. tritici TaxID=62690 RepID=A0A9X9PRT6_BLUGR|nr:Outer membrane protein TOM13 [Blumeria graminis f. sp. tritici 96224]VCU40648.1 Bgt-2688 [Blumeria graminis f. sp. tritici]